MKPPLLRGAVALLLDLCLFSALGAAQLDERCGEPLDPRTYGPAWVESLDDALAREAAFGAGLRRAHDPSVRGSGAWRVPSRGASGPARSGDKVAINEWGDPRMGIGFPRPVELIGLALGGQGGEGAWPPAVRVVGFRAGIEIARTGWLRELEARPRWIALGFEGVDRVELEALPAVDGAAWYALDDLTYAVGEAPPVVVDFEACAFGQRLSGSGHAGLEWERGTGFERALADEGAVPGPRGVPPVADGPAPSGPPAAFLGGLGTAPVLVHDFAGLRRFQTGNVSFPPDTCGAIGPAHFAEIVNRSFAVFDRVNGGTLAALTLAAFLPGAGGDPRILYDQYEDRWVVIATDFGARIQLAVSLTGDPSGDWFKTDFVAAQGSDAGCEVDYPTLGLDERGYYVGAFLVGCGYTLFAIDKAPLVASSPALGTITAFRGLEIEGALQPAHTWGASPGEYVVSTTSPDRIRVRRVNPPISAPTLQTVGFAQVSQHDPPPNAPALGSTVGLAAAGDRLMNAVWRDGSVWTTHGVRVDGRGAVRWYELDAASAALVQEGTVADPVRHYIYPSIAVNADGDAALGFTGSSASEFASAYFTGRLASDPPGETAPPALLRAGFGAYNVLDPQGRNRWGDYSLTTLDPLDERTLWTVQEYTHQEDIWGTWIGRLEFGGTPLCPDPGTFCVSAPNSVGPGARIGFAGSPSVSLADLRLETTGCPPNRTAVFFYGPAQVAVPFGDGLRCVGGPLHRLPPVLTDSFGDAALPVDFGAAPAGAGPGALSVGSVWGFQLWYADPAAGGSGFNLSDALELTMCP